MISLFQMLHRPLHVCIAARCAVQLVYIKRPKPAVPLVQFRKVYRLAAVVVAQQYQLCHRRHRLYRLRHLWKMILYGLQLICPIVQAMNWLCHNRRTNVCCIQHQWFRILIRQNQRANARKKRDIFNNNHNQIVSNQS